MAIELMVVVVGILIALQLDQWAQTRQERQLEYAYLLQLKEDLQVEYSRADAAEEWARDRLSAVELLNRIAADPAVAAGDLAAIPWAVETASWRSFPKARAFVYDELQNTGQMRLIRSLPLRRELADHYGYLARDAWVGMDRSAEQSFDEATAGLLSMKELIAVERAAGGRREIAIDRNRAIAMVNDFSERPNAIRQLPSLAQHHLFNLQVISDMKLRIRRLIAAVDKELRQRAA